MNTLITVYWICFGVGLLFSILSAVTAGVFGGHDFGGHDFDGHPGAEAGGGAEGHAEAGFTSSSDMPGFSPLSPTIIAAFVTAFGGLGLIFSEIQILSSPLVNAPLAVLGGITIAVLLFWMFQSLFRHTQSSSEAKVSTLVGQPATVITPIPPEGVGEIAYVQCGSRYSAPARCQDGQALRNGQAVIITQIIGTQFYVTSM